jgi:cholesterol transport system auxiliary component
LVEFGVDSSSNEAIVVFDALLTQNGKPLEKRRFEARVAAMDINAEPAGVALNKAANQVAVAISDWLQSQGS